MKHQLESSAAVIAQKEGAEFCVGGGGGKLNEYNSEIWLDRDSFEITLRKKKSLYEKSLTAFLPCCDHNKQNPHHFHYSGLKTELGAQNLET